jgi:hypothetical protein
MKDDHVRQSYAGHRSRSYSPPKKDFCNNIPSAAEVEQ